MFKLFSCWHDGKESAEDDEMGGCPSTSVTNGNISKTETAVYAKGNLTIRKLARDFNVSHGLVHQILTENLNIHQIGDKFVLQILTAT